MATLIQASWINNLYTALNTTLPGKGFDMTNTASRSHSSRARAEDTDINAIINMVQAQRNNEFFTKIKNSTWPSSAPTVSERSKISATTKTWLDTKVNEMLSMNFNFSQATFATTTNSTNSRSGDGQTHNSTCTESGNGKSSDSTCSDSGDGRSSDSTCSESGNGRSVDSTCTESPSGDGHSFKTNTSDGVTTYENYCDTSCSTDARYRSFSTGDNGFNANTTFSTSSNSRSGNGRASNSTNSQSGDGRSVDSTCSQSGNGRTHNSTCTESGDGKSSDATCTDSGNGQAINQTCTNFSRIAAPFSQTN